MTYLIDTCILSKLRKLKKHPNSKLESWIKKHPESLYFISVLTIGEIQKGISKLHNHDQRHKMILQNWLVADLIPRFKDRILPIDEHIASTWGEICGKAQMKGHSLPTIDSLLAATAIHCQLILVTENIKDFIHTGARLFNPLE